MRTPISMRNTKYEHVYPTPLEEKERKASEIVWLWCVVCGVWCVVCGVWCVVCGVWRVACGVCGVVCGVWRVVFGVWVGVGVWWVGEGVGGRTCVGGCVGMVVGGQGRVV